MSTATQRTTQTRRERRLAERAARHDTRGHGRPARRIGLGTLSVLGIIGGLAAVVLAITLGARPAPAIAETASLTFARVPAALATDGFALGRADAPVTIDLYEDFQCPACQTWSEGVFPSLAANEVAAGTVRIVFHDMAFLGPESTDAGRAAFAAAEQGRFWDMWATIYANQGRENSGAFTRDRLLAMADGLGFNVDQFEADMASSAAQASIAESRAAAASAGVTSTPTLVIGGRSFVGVQPYPEIAAAIAAAAQ
jgi:protein-disulfide isomerase